MTIQPTSISANSQANNLDALTLLIKQLPLDKILQAKLLTIEKQSLLIINQGKTISIQLPALLSKQGETKATVKIIEKSPLLKVLIELKSSEAKVDNKTTSSTMLLEKQIPSSSEKKLSKELSQKLNNNILEQLKLPQNNSATAVKLPIALAIAKLGIEQSSTTIKKTVQAEQTNKPIQTSSKLVSEQTLKVTEAIRNSQFKGGADNIKSPFKNTIPTAILKNISFPTKTKTAEVVVSKTVFEITLKANTQPQVRAINTDKASKPIVEINQNLDSALITKPSKLINTVQTQQTNALNKILWPQHAALEKLSQNLIIAKLDQLNTSLPTQGKEPFVEVLQKWIKELVTTSNQNKLSTESKQFIQNIIDGHSIKKAIKNSGHLWEASLKNELVTGTSKEKTGANVNTSGLNIKAQILRIIQSFPLILSKLSPELAARFISTETEIWQLVLKIQQQLNIQTKGSMPAPSSQLQPEVLMNWLEQNLKLLTLFLRNIEHHQAEQPPQNNQQTLLRLDLPVPTESGTEWLKLEIEEQEKQKKKQKQWNWQLSLNFNFGEDKKLTTITKIGDQNLSIIFEGGSYFENKMDTATLNQFAEKIEETTNLKSTVEFNNTSSDFSPTNNSKLHLEI